jgi:hypothetical protein
MSNCPAPKDKRPPPCPKSSCAVSSDDRYDLQSVMQDYDSNVQNLNYNDLCERLKKFQNEQVYAYVIDTLRLDDGLYYQTASGPNFEGGIITLCTCKRRMRTFKPAKDWENGVWVAGFTGLTHADGQNLVYLMRIGEAFENFRAVWNDSKLARQVKKTKSATNNPRGDFYEPLPGNTTNPLLPEAYRAPCGNHVHHGEWEDDINTEYYKDKRNNPSALLIGDPLKSYIWQSPKLKSRWKISQGQLKEKLSDFVMVDPSHHHHGLSSIPNAERD